MAEPTGKDVDRLAEDRVDAAFHRRRIREAAERGEQPVSWEEAERRLGARDTAKKTRERTPRT